MDKNTIKRNFSRYAKYYDKYATVQNLSALELIARAGTEGFGKILDIGCGTGNYTRLLRDRFPSAGITGIDISKEMIALARSKMRDKRLKFIIQDAETINLNEKFDLITSNACFQWFENPEETLMRYKNLLRPGGTILFSLFGPLTLRELNASLKELFKKDISINAGNFMTRENLKKILKKHLKRIVIEEEIVKERHDSVWALLNKIKYTGTRGAGINAGNISGSGVKELEKIYRKKFTNFTATYQIFYCRASR